MLRFLRWDKDDAITYDPVRMRITNQTQPKSIQFNY
jgi:hypothetical protein